MFCAKSAEAIDSKGFRLRSGLARVRKAVILKGLLFAFLYSER